MRTAPSPRSASVPELPPHLRPMAVLNAAPRTERRLPVLGALVIYGLMPLGLVAMDRYAPAVGPKPVTRTEWVHDVQLNPTPSGGPAKPLSAPPAPPSPRKTDDLPKLPTQETPTDEVPATPATLPVGPTDQDGTIHHNTGPYDPNSRPTGPVGPFSTHTDVRGTGTGGGGPVNFEATGLRILKQVDPRYPAPAKMARIQGEVVLRMLVDEQGVPVKADVVSGHGMLAGEATRAAMQWRFEAARVGSQPVRATFLLTLKFRLV